MSAITINNLEKHYDGVKAVNDLSINIEPSKITSIIGPNGSGKTTLMHLLSGVADISAGSIVVGGVEKTSIKTHETYTFALTRTFQAVRLFEQMSVLDNILVVLTERSPLRSLLESHREFHENKARAVLEFMGLKEKLNEQAGNLSFGQRKLLEIARVLAVVDMGADIVLLDEPFSGLFPEMVKHVKAAIDKLRSEGKTVVLIEHSMSLIRELSDHVIVMDAGKLLAEGSAEEVLKNKKVIEAYLGE